MRTLWIKTLALAAGSVMYSHAVFGIGGQWAPAPSLEVKKSTESVVGTGARSFDIAELGVDGLNGFGIKLWIDFLPFVDLELSSNVQYGEYDLTLAGPTGPATRDTVAVKFDLDVPLAPEKPMFARIVTDVSVLYPFLRLPPLVSVIKLYAGAGVSHALATEVLTASFARKALAKKSFDPATGTIDQASEILIDAIVDEGLSSSFGFHLQAGAKAKPPIIPLAIFANVKYHFLSSMPSQVDANAVTYELGGALAF